MKPPPGAPGAGVPPTLPESRALAPARGLHLVIFHRDGVRAAPLPASRELVVGRAPESDVRLDAPLMSRSHFSVRRGEPPRLQDLRSANGTRVNGARLEPGAEVALEAGSLIEAGGVFFSVQDSAPAELGAAAARPPQPESAGREGTVAPVVVVDPAMVRLHELVDLVARSSIPVLVVGETGVGKEVISAGVHARSSRSDRPLVSLNCAALPETLLESELFGYEKGSFTGAVQAKPGLIESAHGGTLFLDEIGEMPLPTQAKLLRVLENGELMRVGALKPRQVDVRFIAATNRNISRLVARGAFRRDLYFRLNGITIPVPPLRERPSEIAPLAHFLLGRAARRAARPCPALGPEVLALLAAHAWPGNIRELRNVMERALALCTGPVLQPEHVLLDAELPDDEPQEPPPALPAKSEPPRDAGRLMRLDADTERQLIVKALENCGGNQSKACELLGISRRTLVNRLDEHGLKRPRKAPATE